MGNDSVRNRTKEVIVSTQTPEQPHFKLFNKHFDLTFTIIVKLPPICQRERDRSSDAVRTRFGFTKVHIVIQRVTKQGDTKTESENVGKTIILHLKKRIVDGVSLFEEKLYLRKTKNTKMKNSTKHDAHCEKQTSSVTR